MGKPVILISEAETFSVRGIEMKLKGMGIDTVFLRPVVKELSKYSGDASLIILHTDENIDKNADALVYIKDRCDEKDIQVAVIGTKDEYEAVTQYVKRESIMEFFERPLEMETFLDHVETYLSDEAQHERRKSILIVDDDVAYMSMIFDWLKDRYRVSMANSGMKAITHLAKNKADLILLDYEMPVTTGPQVLEMIRSEAETSDIPVMFLTGKGDRESIMKVLSLKPADYLLKTIDRQGLRDKLNNFFMSKRQG